MYTYNICAFLNLDRYESGMGTLERINFNNINLKVHFEVSQLNLVFHIINK